MVDHDRPCSGSDRASGRLTEIVEARSFSLRRPEDAADELRHLGESVEPGRSLLDELLAERRAEAAAE